MVWHISSILPGASPWKGLLGLSRWLEPARCAFFVTARWKKDGTGTSNKITWRTQVCWILMTPTKIDLDIGVWHVLWPNTKCARPQISWNLHGISHILCVCAHFCCMFCRRNSWWVDLGPLGLRLFRGEVTHGCWSHAGTVGCPTRNPVEDVPLPCWITGWGGVMYDVRVNEVVAEVQSWSHQPQVWRLLD